MRDPARLPGVLNAVWAYWSKHPDLRLAQLICNADKHGDPYYMEDDTLVDTLAEMGCPACRERDISNTCHACGRDENSKGL